MEFMKKLILCSLYYGFASKLPVSYMPGGKFAMKIRYWICSKLFRYCGKNVNIEPCAFIHSGKDISIGDNSAIGQYAALHGTVRIGNDVMMGPNVTIWTANHNFSQTDIPMNQQGISGESPVTIKDDVWIGSNVVILAGVTIGQGAIVGAGAIVTKDVPDWAVVAGNPAKVIKMRRESNTKTEKVFAV